MSPAALADGRTRIRRLYFDMIGLPPQPEQVAQFCRDASVESWTQTVDRLLATPAFAEHWARHWLDVVRYADTNGNDFNATYHQAWRYRNYIINSLSTDKPYDRFVREQLAGDLMPYVDQKQQAEQLIATGFLMLGPKMLSERDKKKLQLDVADEQIDTFGKAFLGLTLGCARCHDHKFDPVPSRDYYALAGVFCSTTTLEGEIQEFVSDWVEQDLPTTPEHARQLAAYQRSRQDLEGRIKELQQQRNSVQNEIDRISLMCEGLVVDNGEAELCGEWKESKHVKRFVGADYLHDDNRDKGNKSVIFSATVPTDGAYEIRLSYTAGDNRATRVPVEIRCREAVVHQFINQTLEPEVDRLFHPLGTYELSAGTHPVVIVSNGETDGYVIADAVQLLPVQMQRGSVALPSGPQPEASRIVTLREQLQRFQDESRRLKEELGHLEEQSPRPRPKAMAVRDAAHPEDIALRIRGVHTNLGPLIPRGFLQAFSSGGPSSLSNFAESGRLELAEWTTSSAKPLLARVMVNRIWQHLIGVGIVRTCDNFGKLGELPTHPELLDVLASDFIAHDWSVKYLVRRIVSTQTYQAQVDSDRPAQDIDPENRLLSHAHRKRLTAEQYRDALLAVSQSLDRSIGKSPVAQLGKLVNDNSANGTNYKGQSTSQRSIYLPIVRNELPEFLVAFDFADPDRVVGRRPETNVPVQALLLLNHPFVREAAERTVLRVLDELNDDRRLDALYQIIFQRAPHPNERRRDQEFLHRRKASSRFRQLPS